MLRNILVPLDGSPLAEGVLPHAVAIAKAFDAQITLLNIMEQPAESLRRPQADPLDWYLQKTEAKTYLEVVKARLEKSNVRVETILLEGRAADQIVDLAHNGDIDLLILSSHGGRDTGGNYVSGVAQEVLQRTRTSTMLIRAHMPVPAQPGELTYRRILVPLDGSRRAGAALPLATSLLQAHDAQLILAHVVSRPEMARQMPLTREDAALIERVIERNQEEGEKYLEQVRAYLPAAVQTRLLVSDNVAATLQRCSEQEQCDLLILSAHGYSGEARWPYGSVTNRFITDGNMPLLIVQDLPDDSLEVVREDAAARQMAR